MGKQKQPIRTTYPTKKDPPCYKCITYPVCKSTVSKYPEKIVTILLYSMLTSKCELLYKYIYSCIHYKRQLYFRMQCLGRIFKCKIKK